MNNLTHTRIFELLASILMAITLSNVSAQAADNTAQGTAQQQIQTVISTTYDRPGHKVETVPVVIADGYAIADWIQGEKGGRALLRHTNEQWEIMACGGDGFKDVKLLQDAGIPAKTAKNLVAQLTKAEQSVSADRVKRFGLFGTPNDPRLVDHHAHSKP